MTTIKQRMKLVKDNPEHLQQKVVYMINCSCGEQYIGEEGKSVKIRLKENGVYIHNERDHSSNLVEHAGKTNHHICLKDTKVIANEKHHFKCKFREALQTIKPLHNLNRDAGLEIRRNWISLLKSIEQKAPQFTLTSPFFFIPIPFTPYLSFNSSPFSSLFHLHLLITPHLGV